MAIDWNTVVFNMLTIKGIYGREMYETWYKMTVMLQSGLDIRPVITHRFPLHGVSERLRRDDVGAIGQGDSELVGEGLKVLSASHAAGAIPRSTRGYRPRSTAASCFGLIGKLPSCSCGSARVTAFVSAAFADRPQQPCSGRR